MRGAVESCGGMSRVQVPGESSLRPVTRED